MLILSRKPGEEIYIQIGNELVIVQLVEIRGDRVRIGVTAPTEIRVDRKEVYRRIHEDKTKTNASTEEPPAGGQVVQDAPRTAREYGLTSRTRSRFRL